MTPREKAEACYALARSTTHDGERQAAIGRGDAICKRHGLPLDDFDVPGRPKSRSSAGKKANADGAERLFDRPNTNPWNGAAAYTFADVAAAMQRFKKSMEEASRVAGAREGETVHDARRRNFDDAINEALMRDIEREGRRRRLNEAASRLSSRGLSVYPDQPGRWFVYEVSGCWEANDEQLLELDRQVAERVKNPRRAA